MSGPLIGLKVLDFSTLLPGPCATLMLADMGADVLRVESPTRLDLLRAMPPQTGGVSAAHAYLNRGKRSLALDLKTPAALGIVKRLLQEYDILVEQFRPGVMARLGLGYDDLRAEFPQLIYCSITGYGQTGPYAERAGHDINYLALAGVSGHSGRQESGPPPLGIQVADVAGGSHHAVMAILAAVIERQRTGEGQALDISMTDAAFVLNHMSLASHLAGAPSPEREADLLNGGGFYDYYRTKDGRYLAVGSLEPQFAQGLCQLVDMPELMTRILSQTEEDRALCKSRLRDAFAKYTLGEWLQRLEGRDICVEPVLTLEEACQHPQIQARKLVCENRTPAGVVLLQPASALHFSNHSFNPAAPGSRLGEHTQEVLSSLGYTKEELAAWAEEGLFGKVKVTGPSG